jgi:hypothetical protein
MTWFVTVGVDEYIKSLHSKLIYILFSMVLLGLLAYKFGPDLLLFVISHAKRAQSIQRRPHRIIIIRHGESMGNLDPTIYARIPDNQVPLSEIGMRQAEEVGRLPTLLASTRRNDQFLICFQEENLRT